MTLDRKDRVRRLLQKVNQLEADVRRVLTRDYPTVTEKLLLKSIADLASAFGSFLEDECCFSEA